MANEGINAQISYHLSFGEKSFAEFIVSLGFDNINVKYNYSNIHPFKKHLVWRRWNEIIPMGVSNVDVNANKGDYLDGDEWDAICSKDNCVTIDTRNDYEITFGTFKDSVNPRTDTFKEFPNWVVYEFIPNIHK